MHWDLEIGPRRLGRVRDRDVLVCPVSFLVRPPTIRVQIGYVLVTEWRSAKRDRGQALGHPQDISLPTFLRNTRVIVAPGDVGHPPRGTPGFAGVARMYPLGYTEST